MNSASTTQVEADSLDEQHGKNHSTPGASKLIPPDTVTACLRRLTKLNVYKAKYGEAPHKALLLLVLIGLAERDELPSDILLLTPELAFRFDTYWEVVAYRLTQRSDVRLPFHHLSCAGRALASEATRQ